MKQKLDFMLAALQAVPTDNYSVYIYCNDGSVRFMDMKPLLQDGTVFEPLKDIKVSATQTVADQQAQGRRPRFSIQQKIIDVYNLQPDAIFYIRDKKIERPNK